MNTIICSIRTFVGGGALRGERVVVLSVHRGGPDGVILENDAEIGRLRPDDVIEVAQLVAEDDAQERLTRVTCDAKPHELGRAEELWRGSTETGFLLRGPDPRRN